MAEAIASGRFDLDRKQKSPQELVAAFGDWSPIVRGWAAEELAKRPEAKAMAPQLIAMAEGNDVHVAEGACEALGYIKSEQALPALVRLLTHEDRWLRFKAAEALKNMGSAAKPAVPDILKAVVKTAEPLQPIDWADSIQLTHGQLAAALFRRTDGIPQGGRSRTALSGDPGIISRNADGMARATLRDFFENKLTLADVQALAPDLLAAVKTRCPADTMFGSEIRMGALKALTKYHYQEGIEAGIVFAKTQGGHGSESRTGEIMKEIVSYGSAARESLPALKEVDRSISTPSASEANFPRANSTTGVPPPWKQPSRPSRPQPRSPSCGALPPRRPRQNSDAIVVPQCRAGFGTFDPHVPRQLRYSVRNSPHSPISYTCSATTWAMATCTA